MASLVCLAASPGSFLRVAPVQCAMRCFFVADTAALGPMRSKGPPERDVSRIGLLPCSRRSALWAQGDEEEEEVEEEEEKKECQVYYSPQFHPFGPKAAHGGGC